jgi:ATP-dependent Clp protease ATP-binding subunit ClpA
LCQCIGATTTSDYKKYIETDLALQRRFGAVKVPEPKVDESTGILIRASRERYLKTSQSAPGIPMKH